MNDEQFKAIRGLLVTIVDATGGHWVQIWTGNSAELFGQREREPASIRQVDRLIGADVDAGRIHRLAVFERPAQIEAAIAGARQFS